MNSLIFSWDVASGNQTWLAGHPLTVFMEGCFAGKKNIEPFYGGFPTKRGIPGGYTIRILSISLPDPRRSLDIQIQ